MQNIETLTHIEILDLIEEKLDKLYQSKSNMATQTILNDIGCLFKELRKYSLTDDQQNQQNILYAEYRNIRSSSAKSTLDDTGFSCNEKDSHSEEKEIQEKRIGIIKYFLNQERNGKIVSEMSKEYRNQLCKDFNVLESEIIGIYVDVMKLGKAIVSSASNNFNCRGVLFLRDRFIYNKKKIKNRVEIYYDELNFVETNSKSTQIYYGNDTNTLDNGSYYTMLELSRTSYTSPSKIPELFLELTKTSKNSLHLKKQDIQRSKAIERNEDLKAVKDFLDIVNDSVNQINKKF